MLFLIKPKSSWLQIESRPTNAQFNRRIYSNKLRIEELVVRRSANTNRKEAFITPPTIMTSSNGDRILDFLRRNATFSLEDGFRAQNRMNEPPAQCR